MHGVCVDAHNITGTSYMEIYGYNTLGFTLTGGIRFTCKSMMTPAIFNWSGGKGLHPGPLDRIGTGRL